MVKHQLVKYHITAQLITGYAPPNVQYLITVYALPKVFTYIYQCYNPAKLVHLLG